MNEEKEKGNKNNYRSVLEFSNEETNEEAKEFFLKSTSYNGLDLPPYFVFDKLLKSIDKIINNEKLSGFCCEKPNTFENVNYTLFNNKNGKYPKSPDRVVSALQEPVNPPFRPYGWSLPQILPRVLLKNRCSADCQC